MSLSDLRLALEAGKQRGLIRKTPYSVNTAKRVWLTVISLDGRHAVALQCGVRLLVSTSRTPPHCEGHSAFPVDNRDVKRRWVVPPTLHHSGHGGCQIAPPRWLPPTLPRTRIGGECGCDAGMQSNKQQHTLSRGWSAQNT